MAQRCTRYKRVRSKFGGTVRRCASYSGRSANGRRRRRGYRRRRGGLPRGSTCVRFKRVRVRGGGIQRRCAKYRARGGRRPAAAARRRTARGRYRRGRVPYNKGKKCLMRKRVYSERLGRHVTRCASYGAGRITRRERMLGPGRPGTAIVRRNGDDRFPGFFSR